LTTPTPEHKANVLLEEAMQDLLKKYESTPPGKQKNRINISVNPVQKVQPRLVIRLMIFSLSFGRANSLEQFRIIVFRYVNPVPAVLAPIKMCHFFFSNPPITFAYSILATVTINSYFP